MSRFARFRTRLAAVPMVAALAIGGLVIPTLTAATRCGRCGGNAAAPHRDADRRFIADRTDERRRVDRL